MKKRLTTANGVPVSDNRNSLTAGERGPIVFEDFHLFEKLAHFNRERIPERVVHAKGSGAYGKFVVMQDITRFTKAKLFATVGKKTPIFIRFSTVGGEKGSADTERDPRGFAMKFYTEDGIWDLVGNNTPVFFIRDPSKFSGFHPHAEARPADQLEVADGDVGLLVAASRVVASGHDALFGSRHAGRLSLHARLRQPHLQFDQRQERAVFREVAFQDEARHQEPDAATGARARRERPGLRATRSVRGDRARRLSEVERRDHPNSFDQVITEREVEVPPYAGAGPVARYDHRLDADYYSQAGALFRLMETAQKKLLIDNIVGAMRTVPEFIQRRQVAHFLKADKAYGEGVAKGLGLAVTEESAVA